MRRRDFITLIGGSAALSPVATFGQSAMPVVGLLSAGETTSPVVKFFLRGLSEAGYVESRNVVIEGRFADGHYDRLPTLAADLVHRRVSVIVTTGTPAALAAKAATKTIPIVFGFGGDPVRSGLVASLNRPSGNATGVTFLTSQLESKRLGLLRELVPQASRIALLLNRTNPNAVSQVGEVSEAARILGLQLHVVSASREAEFEPAFVTIAKAEAEGILVAADPFYFSSHERLVALAARYAKPAMYDFRAYAEAGGLASYGTHLGEAYRQVGVYTARILNGEKATDLPVMQSTRFEFVINLRTARALALEISPMLSARADEVIE